MEKSLYFSWPHFLIQDFRRCFKVNKYSKMVSMDVVEWTNFKMRLAQANG